MRVSIDVDEELLEAAFRCAPVSTNKELVTLALREYVEHHRRRDLRALKGQSGIAADYDHRRLRERDSGG